VVTLRKREFDDELSLINPLKIAIFEVCIKKFIKFLKFIKFFKDINQKNMSVHLIMNPPTPLSQRGEFQ
jgi:hypothetical protein